MTGNKNDSADGDEPTATPGFDPAELRDRDGVEYEERTYTHESDDHCEASADGRVIVGVGDEAVVVLTHRDRPLAMLPNETLGAGDSWRPVARETAEPIAGVPVTLGDPVRARRIEHYTDGEEKPNNVTHHVLFAASLGQSTGHIEPRVEGDEWTADWHDTLPPALEDEDGDAVADIGAVLE